MTAHRIDGPHSMAAEQQAADWSALLYALGQPWPGRHLAGRHMRGFPSSEAADAAELTAGFRPGGAHRAVEGMAA